MLLAIQAAVASALCLTMLVLLRAPMSNSLLLPKNVVGMLWFLGARKQIFGGDRLRLQSLLGQMLSP